MLRKTAITTVVPAVPERAFVPATHTCYSVPPSGTGGDSLPPTEPPPSGPVVPAPGTVIYLEPLVGDPYPSVAPAPAGYACRYEAVWVYAPGQTEPAAFYNIVCTES